MTVIAISFILFHIMMDHHKNNWKNPDLYDMIMQRLILGNWPSIPFVLFILPLFIFGE